MLDCTVCHANALCKVPEQVSLPSALDAQGTFVRNDAVGCLVGLSPGACQRAWPALSSQKLFQYVVSVTSVQNSAHALVGNASGHRSLKSLTRASEQARA